MAKHGHGYKSSAYTGAAKRNTSSDSSDSDEDIVPLSEVSPVAVTSTRIENEDDYCLICNGNETNWLVGIGLTVIPDDEEIDWIQCSGCSEWVLFLSAAIEKEDVNEDVDWYCPSC